MFPHLLVPPAISDTNGNATIIIESNDDPHGVVSFTASTFHVAEGEFNAITVTRAAGKFGEVGAKQQKRAWFACTCIYTVGACMDWQYVRMCLLRHMLPMYHCLSVGLCFLASHRKHSL